MKNDKFHQLNAEFFKNLEAKGFERVKKKSTWLRQGTNGVSIELSVRQDRYGWFPQYGSSFMYDLMPYFAGKPVHYYLAKQMRLFELKEYDPSLIKKAVEILSTFASKIPQDDSCAGDTHYVLLKSPWTEQKIERNIGDWYCFYDEEDLLNWHNVLYPALLKAIDKTQKQFESEDFQKRSVSKGQFQKAAIDPETGEINIA